MLTTLGSTSSATCGQFTAAGAPAPPPDLADLADPAAELVADPAADPVAPGDLVAAGDECPEAEDTAFAFEVSPADVVHPAQPASVAATRNTPAARRRSQTRSRRCPGLRAALRRERLMCHLLGGPHRPGRGGLCRPRYPEGRGIRRRAGTGGPSADASDD
jgi:hypothetical protein